MHQSLSFQLAHNKTNKMNHATSEDSDQPGYLPSLIRAFPVHSMGSPGPSASSCGQRRLIRLGGRPGSSESWLGTQVILLVLLSSHSFAGLMKTSAETEALINPKIKFAFQPRLIQIFFVLHHQMAIRSLELKFSIIQKEVWSKFWFPYLFYTF